MTSAEPIQTHDDGFVDELKPGTKLMHGQYTIMRYLNSGGFGITYLASDSLNRTVVIKECFPGAFCHRSNMLVQARSRAYTAELRTIVKLFTQEAHALAKLRHPNIVGVHHVFEENNTAYMALDFLEGRDLLSIIDSKEVRLAPSTVQILLAKLLDATAFVHNAGLLHRDISPDNIIVTSAHEPILIDFGAAREQATRTTRALSALRVVKDGYSPQEFYVAGRQQGPSSDLYSLAASFYHLITGDIPPDSQMRIAAHVAGEPDPYVPLARRVKDYDPAFCAALDRAMSILPKDRVQSSREWLDMIAGRKPVPPAPAPSPAVRLDEARAAVKPQVAPKRRLSLVAGSLAALAVVGGALVLIGPPDRADLPQTAVASASAPPTVPSMPPETVAAGAATSVETAPPSAAAAEPTRTAVAVAVDPQTNGAAPAASGAGLPAPLALDGSVTGDWTVDFPFTTAAADPLLIEAVVAGAPATLAPGNRIVAVNGKPVSALHDAVAIARSGQVAADGRSAAVTLLVEDRASGGVVAQQLDVPVVHETEFASGLRLRSRFENGAWVTKVAIVPAGQQGGLRSGDVLVALMPSQEIFEDVATVRTLVAREMDAGRDLVRVAVRRDGSMWVETLALGDTAS